MSYILAALKKADQEHFLGSVPDLATPQEVQPAEPRYFRWGWVIGALLIVNAALVVMLLRDRGTEVTAAPVAEQASVPKQAPVAKQAPATPERQSSPVNDHVKDQVNGRESQPVVQTSDTREGEKSVLQGEAPETDQPVRSRGEVIMLPEPARSQSSEPLVLTNQKPDVQADVAETASDDPQVQNWFDLPAEFRNKIDLPRLDVHVYSNDPQGRFILVNLKKYREGDTLPNGLVLEEVFPDGMVMSYQGKRFRVDK